MDVLKVASHSNPNSLSGAIVGALEDDGVVELHAVGAGAVSQAVKAIAIARRLIGNWATRRSEPDRDSSTLRSAGRAASEGASSSRDNARWRTLSR